MFRLPYNCSHLTSKVMLKNLQIRLLQYVNHELLNVQAGFRKGRGTRDQIANIHWIMEKALISHASKVIMLKILQARLQQYMNRELPNVQAGFRKAEEPEIKLPTSAGSWKKQENSRKTSISALLTTPKPLSVWITTNCGKFFKRWEYQTTLCASWEICIQVKKQQLEPDMEQQTGSKLGKEYVYVCILSYVCYVYWVCILGKTVYCYPA